MARKKGKTKLVYVTDDGRRFDVIRDDGKFIYGAGDIQFRKSANRGTLIKVPIEEPKADEQKETED